jgi:SAM-dependent methyltransferase
MIAEPLVEVRCAVCAGEEHAVVCPAAEVRAQMQYLERFHRRRLCPGPNGRPPREALVDRAHFTQDYATDIVACRGCGLVFRNPRPTTQAITGSYEHDHYGPERLAALFQSQRELYRRRARRLGHWLGTSQPVRIVEVGSFVGGFLAAGAEHGWEMLGVDLGEEVVAFCHEKGLRVFLGTLAEAPLAPASVDAIAIWNTFDQLPDPEPTLVAARRALRPGGILALRVPNGDCFRLLTRWEPRLPRVLRGWLHSAMAWNNLLAFPYLHGYSIVTLDGLLSRHTLARVAAAPDTLLPLADAQTRPWAAWEERATKALWRLALRALEICRKPAAGALAAAPWLDAYYRPRRYSWRLPATRSK